MRAYAGWPGYPLALPCGAPYVVWPSVSPPKKPTARPVASMRAAFGELGWWFDTSALTPEETAEQVLADAYDLGRRGH